MPLAEKQFSRGKKGLAYKALLVIPTSGLLSLSANSQSQKDLNADQGSRASKSAGAGEACRNTIGHLLDPAIETSLPTSEPLGIADFACGKGAWLSDVARQLSKKGFTAQLRLDGYDVNTALVPAPTLLSNSITPKGFDVLSEIPEELKGAYDIVHIRAFCSILINSDTGPLLTAAKSLLKPDGWIQWEESTSTQYIVEAPSPSVSKANCEAISNLLMASGEAQGLELVFTENLDRELTKAGFGNVRMEIRADPREDLQAWTDD